MSINWRYIRDEILAVLLVMYAIGIGGTLNGLVAVRIEIITLVIITVVGLWWCIRLRRRPSRLPDLALPLLGLGLGLLVATLFSSDLRRSLIQFGYWAVITMAYWIASDLTRADKNFERFERALLAALSAFAIIGLYQLWNWWRSVGFAFLTPIRPVSIFGNPNPFSTALLVTCAIVLRRLFLAPGRSVRLVAGFWLLVMGSMLFLAGARSALLGAVAGLLVIGLLFLWHSRKTQWRPPAWAKWSIGVGLLVVVIVTAALLVSRPQVMRNMFVLRGHGTLSQRSELWRSGWITFLQRPLVGYGPMTFGSQYLQYGSIPPEQIHAHPHNIILYLAAEAGIVGVLALGGVLVVSGRSIWQLWRSEEAQSQQQAILMAGYWAAIFVNGMFDVTFVPSVSILVLWGWLVLARHADRQVETPSWQVNLSRVLAPTLTVLSVGLWGFQIPAEMAATDGVWAADNKDWGSAFLHFRRAADRDPGMVVYIFQAAYAGGQAGILGDEAALEWAIKAYRDALKREPWYAVHWANLAVLEAYAGQHDQAIKDAEYAAALAPDSFGIARLPQALDGQPFDCVSESPHHEAYFGVGMAYSWDLFHVPGMDMQLLPPPGFEGSCLP